MTNKQKAKALAAQAKMVGGWAKKLAEMAEEAKAFGEKLQAEADEKALAAEQEPAVLAKNGKAKKAAGAVPSPA